MPGATTNQALRVGAAEEAAAAEAVSFTFVVPVFRGSEHLDACLGAVNRQRTDGDRVIVVFDGECTVADRRIARSRGADVIVLPENRGQAAARNAGARIAYTDHLFLVDVDVQIQPTAREVARRHLAAGADAVIGAYTPRPARGGLITTLKNLQHSYMHASNAGSVATFWTGCAAISRDAYHGAGGMDEDLRYCEDIALGAKLHRAGRNVVLDPTLAGSHAKTYSPRSWLRSELMERAIPWTRLLLARRAVPYQLNASRRGLFGVACAAVFTVCSAAAALGHPVGPTGAIASLAALSSANRGLLAFTIRHTSPAHALAMIALLVGHYMLGALGATIVTVQEGGRKLARLI